MGVAHGVAAKKKKKKKPQPQLGQRDPEKVAEALEGLERPKMNWKVVAQIAVGFGVLWLVAGMLMPYIGYWGIGIAAVLTVLAAGFGLYIWRMMRKSAAIVDILKGPPMNKAAPPRSRSSRAAKTAT